MQYGIIGSTGTWAHANFLSLVPSPILSTMYPPPPACSCTAFSQPAPAAAATAAAAAVAVAAAAPNPDPGAVKRRPNLLLLVTAWK